MRGLLGADIFVNLLLVFIIATGLLFMNTNSKSATAQDSKLEMSLPKVKLPTGKSDGATAPDNEKVMNLSAKLEGGKINYFLDDKAVERNDLKKMLSARNPDSIKIRFDEQIAYGRYIEMLDLCQQCGISNISNVYTSDQKE